MSSGTALIQSALQQIGAHSVISPAGAESIESGMHKLNAMMMMWLSKGIDLGVVPLGVPGDELSEPMDVRQAIVDNLSLSLAPDFADGKPNVTPELRINARHGFLSVCALYQDKRIPDKVLSSTTPRGAGNDRGVWDRAFVGKQYTVDSNEGES